MNGDGAIVTAPEGTAQDVAEAFAAANPEGSRNRTLVWRTLCRPRRRERR